MQLTITARQLKVPETLEQMLRTKAEKLEHFGHKLIALHAIFGKEKYLYTTELTLSTKGVRLVGHAKHPHDMLTCMEEALMKLERQLKRREAKQVGEAPPRSSSPSVTPLLRRGVG